MVEVDNWPLQKSGLNPIENIFIIQMMSRKDGFYTRDDLVQVLNKEYACILTKILKISPRYAKNM